MPQLMHTRTRNGIWEGLVSTDKEASPPDLRVTHRETLLTDISIQ